MTVAPLTSSPRPTSTGTLSPVSSDRSTAERPSSTMPSVAIFSPGRTTNRSPTAQLLDRHAPLRAVGLEQRRVLGAELEQRAQRRAGPALRARLEVAAGEQEGDDGGRDLEVDLPLAAPRESVSSNGIFIPGVPASRKKSATTDQP